jgi:hypothetical protein
VSKRWQCCARRAWILAVVLKTTQECEKWNMKSRFFFCSFSAPHAQDTLLCSPKKMQKTVTTFEGYGRARLEQAGVVLEVFPPSLTHLSTRFWAPFSIPLNTIRKRRRRNFTPTFGGKVDKWVNIWCMLGCHGMWIAWRARKKFGRRQIFLGQGTLTQHVDEAVCSEAPLGLDLVHKLPISVCHEIWGRVHGTARILVAGLGHCPSVWGNWCQQLGYSWDFSAMAVFDTTCMYCCSCPLSCLHFVSSCCCRLCFFSWAENTLFALHCSQQKCRDMWPVSKGMVGQAWGKVMPQCMIRCWLVWARWNVDYWMFTP